MVVVAAPSVHDKLAADRTSRGDLKLLSRALRELRWAFKVFTPYRSRRKVTVFGSARTRPHEATFQQAVAFAQYQRSRIARTARVVLSAREMGRIFHAQGVERLVRNDLWKGRTPERFYDAMEWLYGWTVDDCLAD